MKFPRTASILTVALVLALRAAATTLPRPPPCAETSPPTTKPRPTTTTETSTTTTSSLVEHDHDDDPADPVMPLTGLPVADPAIAARPAVVVKVSNDPGARPQSGLDSADIVFEAWGAGPDPVRDGVPEQGRSERRPDPLGAYPGRRPRRLVQRRGVRLLRVATPARWRRSARPICWCSPRARAPAGGSTRTVADRTPRSTTRRRCASNAAPDPARSRTAVQYRQTGAAATGRVVRGIQAAHRAGARRMALRPPSRTATCGRKRASRTCWPTARVSQFTNVIVLWIDYEHSPADVRSPDGGTIGTGDAVVFTNGKVIPATWSRDRPT